MIHLVGEGAENDNCISVIAKMNHLVSEWVELCA